MNGWSLQKTDPTQHVVKNGICSNPNIKTETNKNKYLHQSVEFTMICRCSFY